MGRLEAGLESQSDQSGPDCHDGRMEPLPLLKSRQSLLACLPFTPNSDLMKTSQLIFVLSLLISSLLIGIQGKPSQAADWQYSGSLFINSTAEGASIPADVSVKDFPLLVRLHEDWFDFSQAQDNGADIRFVTPQGTPLAFQIEHWNPGSGEGSLWVRIPEILGQSIQEIQMKWGNPDAASKSNGNAVFNASNGYLSVWHMGSKVKDEVGTLASDDTGTTETQGMVGKARHFENQGIFCGDQINTYPTGSSVHTSQAWFRSEASRGRVLAWGNEKAQGKVVMQYRSPPRVHMECYFSDANVDGDITTRTPQWVHAVHTYRRGESLIYLNGVLAGTGNPRATPLNVQSPSRMWIGGWYNRYDFVGDIDEVRISKTVRSPEWIRLEYENQKPLQTLVGPITQTGSDFSLSTDSIQLLEGQRIKLTARAGGAQKIYWVSMVGNDQEILAVDRFHLTYEAQRVAGDQKRVLQIKAIYPDGLKTLNIPVMVKESIPEPIFTLQAPSKWNGRDTIEIVPHMKNLEQMESTGHGQLTYDWKVTGLATINQTQPGKMILSRSQNSGLLTVTATIGNGGKSTSVSTGILVEEPQHDARVVRTPGADERPVDNQFYARDESNQGTLYFNGTLKQPADGVFLKVYADDQLIAHQKQNCQPGQPYAFKTRLAAGLIIYRVEFGIETKGVTKVQYTADNLVCGDAYIIDGQSNALATDTRETSPPETNHWIRSYGKPETRRKADQEVDENLWCLPVWKARNGEKAELGYWGMELAKRLLKSQQVPICIINGAVGGTRIDQHQRNEQDPTDLSTIYGRLLWRVRQAQLTHGIRAVLWHQGENDQGAAGPDGGYGWQTYQRYFIEMSASWKRDFPNVEQYYIFQIWPNACSMGNGNGDMLREIQRTLPNLYSRMSIMSTLGIEPPGGCHYPLSGWAEFAKLIQPVMERDLYQKEFPQAITAPNLQSATFAVDTKDTLHLEFDQPVVWSDDLVDEFYLDGERNQIASGSATGQRLTLKLKAPSQSRKITYLKEQSWSQKKLLKGSNGIAALTFCNVSLVPTDSSRR